jgi:hypothetical protein
MNGPSGRTPRNHRLSSLLALTALVAASGGILAARLNASPAQEPSASPAPVPLSITLPATPPTGAITLIGKSADEMRANWYRRYSTVPLNWTLDAEGIASPQKSDIASKQEFGDCYLHVEYRTPVDASGKPVGEGNSGVALQGRYEVQILGDYGKKPEAGGAGAFYSQKAPRVNASKKAGEWQALDILFRAPRFDNTGKVLEKPRATVFQNGILVQNNEEFPDVMGTGIQYNQYRQAAKTGPIVLQGDHDPVQFRNVWVVPL